MGYMASHSDTCDYPGCGTKLKPLFSSLYCPNEEKHGKSDKAAEYARIIKEAQDLMAKPRIWVNYPAPGIPAFTPHTAPPSAVADCTHPFTVTLGTMTNCQVCGEELTPPSWP
jgi:hypothetical protein